MGTHNPYSSDFVAGSGSPKILQQSINSILYQPVDIETKNKLMSTLVYNMEKLVERGDIFSFDVNTLQVAHQFGETIVVKYVEYPGSDLMEIRAKLSW